MADDVLFKEATPAMAEQLVQLFTSLKSETNSIKLDENVSVSRAQKQLALIQQSPTNLILVAEYQSELVGMISIIEDMSGNQCAELGIGVLKDFWHAGIGTILMDEGLYWADNFSRLQKIWLEVYTDNQYAIKLYQNFDFDTQKAATSVEGRPTIKMERLINLSSE